jgi:hypothetical protein
VGFPSRGYVTEKRVQGLAGEQRLDVQAGHLADIVEDRDVELPAAQPRDLFRRGEVSHLCVHMGIGRLQRLEEVLQPLERKVRDATRSQDFAEAAGATRLGHRTVEGRQHGHGLVRQRGARFRWCDNATGAAKELNAQLVLELANRL